jgi:hypothetical protein
MKNIILSICILAGFIGFSQSKSEQILELNSRVDSLNILLVEAKKEIAKQNRLILKSDSIIKDLQKENRNHLIESNSLYRKMDSLNTLLLNSIPTRTIEGKFIDVSMGDCFHLIFEDSNGENWDFGSAANLTDVDIYGSFFREGEEVWVIGLTQKVTLTIADLYGIICNSAGSYDEGRIQYERMATIIDIKVK